MENERKDIKYYVQRNIKVENLIHLVNKETIKEQHRKQKNNKASGIDKITKEEYEKNIDEKIENLINRMKKFSYKPQPVRRSYIPKSNGKLRPLGIPSYEDKLVQGVMANILNEIYECKFLESSYGFRPNRNCHQAIKKIDNTIMAKKINYILDCDIKGFFDNVNHEWLMKFLEHDIKDKTFLRYINRFLISGYMEDMKYYETDKGTPQGGLISPILANVYLHYVLDLYFEKKIKPSLKGEAHLVRYADDFLIMLQYEREAKQVYKQIKERLLNFGLEMEQEKTRILPFGRYEGTKETFDFLGFMHYNGKSRTGKYMVGHKMTKKKKKMKKEDIKKYIKENRHKDIFEVIERINKKLVGMNAYYGINGMIRELQNIRQYTLITLFHVYRKRSQRNKLTKEQFSRILKVRPVIRPKVYVKIWGY